MSDLAFMIVDDDDVDRYTLKRLLKAAGFGAPVLEMSDGLEALEFFRQCDPHPVDRHSCRLPSIVFLDINMPRMNGFEFLEKFAETWQGTDSFRSVVFLMITSSDHHTDKDLANQFDFVKGYIAKMPATAEELRTQINAYLPGCE